MIRFSLQIEVYAGDDPDCYLFTDRFKCAVCDNRPAAPVQLGPLQQGLANEIPLHAFVVRCEDHIKGGTRPWPHTLNSDMRCESLGCPSTDTKLIRVGGYTFGDYTAKGRACWLCSVHASAGMVIP